MMFDLNSKQLRLWFAVAALGLGTMTLSAPSYAFGGSHGGGGGFHGGGGGFHGGMGAFTGAWADSMAAWADSMAAWVDSTALLAASLTVGWHRESVAFMLRLPLHIRAFSGPRSSLTGPSSTGHSSSTAGLLIGAFSSIVTAS